VWLWIYISDGSQLILHPLYAQVWYNESARTIDEIFAWCKVEPLDEHWTLLVFKFIVFQVLFFGDISGVILLENRGHTCQLWVQVDDGHISGNKMVLTDSLAAVNCGRSPARVQLGKHRSCQGIWALRISDMASLECTYSGELNHYQLLEIRGINLTHSPQHKCHSKHLIDQVRRTSAFIGARLTASYLDIIEPQVVFIQSNNPMQSNGRRAFCMLERGLTTSATHIQMAICPFCQSLYPDGQRCSRCSRPTEG